MLTVLSLNNKNITDFASERNDLLEKSKSVWVLFLDSDERLYSPIKNISDKYNGYFLKRKNYFLGQYVGTDKIVRLGKKNAGRWYRAVHETWKINGNIGILPNIIIHNTADNLRDYINKINIYSGLHAKENLKENKKSNLLKIIFFPPIKFVFVLIKSKNIVFSILQAFHSFLAWSELWLIQSNEN